jgi:hypothetical protein
VPDAFNRFVNGPSSTLRASSGLPGAFDGFMERRSSTPHASNALPDAHTNSCAGKDRLSARPTSSCGGKARLFPNPRFHGRAQLLARRAKNLGGSAHGSARPDGLLPGAHASPVRAPTKSRGGPTVPLGASTVSCTGRSSLSPHLPSRRARRRIRGPAKRLAVRVNSSGARAQRLARRAKRPPDASRRELDGQRFLLDARTKPVRGPAAVLFDQVFSAGPWRVIDCGIRELCCGRR